MSLGCEREERIEAEFRGSASLAQRGKSAQLLLPAADSGFQCLPDVEASNTGRINDALRSNRFDSALDLEQTLMRYVHLDNTQLPQSALGNRPPMQAMKDWHKSRPHPLVKMPRNRPELDRSAIFTAGSAKADQRAALQACDAPETQLFLRKH
jgi:hypothetical protein